MTEHRLKVRHGDVVDLHLPPRPENSQMGTTVREPRRFVGVDGEDEDYVFRKQPNVMFYDLGTQKLDEGGYEYLLPDIPSYVPFPAFDNASAFNEIYLREDRRCLRLGVNAEWLYVDYGLRYNYINTYLNLDVKARFVIGKNEKRPLIKDLRKKIGGVLDPPPPVENDPDHTWKGDGITVKAVEEDDTESKGLIFVESGPYYNPFDLYPNGGDYGITLGPTPEDFIGLEDLVVGASDKIKVFLTPRYSVHGMRLPILPKFELNVEEALQDIFVELFTPFLTPNFGFFNARPVDPLTTAMQELWSTQVNYNNALGLYIANEDEWRDGASAYHIASNFTPPFNFPPPLTAIIEMHDQTYYIWALAPTPNPYVLRWGGTNVIA